MKKTILLIAALVLGATTVNAQKFISLGQQPNDVKKAALKTPSMNDANLTKTKQKPTKEGNIIIDFSSTDDYVMENLPNHTAGTQQGMFKRLDTTAASVAIMQANYPTWIYGFYHGHGDNFDWLSQRMEKTIGNGYAIVSPIQIHDGQVLNTKVFNTVIRALQPINTSGWNCVKISFNQWTMRFNSDRYYIDYSTDANFNTYDSIEFNVKDLEVSANDVPSYKKTVVLPVAGTIVPALYIRVRYYCPVAEDSYQPSGYFWMIDEISAENGEAYALNTIQTYTQGSTYHVIPQGIPLDTVIYYADVENIGGSDIYNGRYNEAFYTRTLDADTNYVYTFVAANAGEPDTLSTAMYNDSTFDNNDVLQEVNRRRHHTVFAKGIGLQPNAQPGYGVAVSTLKYTETAAGTEIKELATGDTISYRTSEVVDTVTPVVWARDYDVLYQSRPWKRGFSREGQKLYLSDDTPDAYISGYTVCNMFEVGYGRLGNENWYLRGVEVVPADDTIQLGAKIQGVLTYINNQAGGNDDYIVPVTDEDGNEITSDIFTITDLASQSNNGILDNSEYTGTRTFNSITLPFTKSVKLSDTISYYACYKVISNGKRFSVGMDYGEVNFNTYYGPRVYVKTETYNPYAWGSFYGYSNYSNGTNPMVRMMVAKTPATSSLKDVNVDNFNMSAYPNPANEEFSINYTLNNSGNVVITLNDILGREVVRMNEGVQTANTSHKVVINTNNLQNGTYFYTVNVNGAKKTNKVVVNK